MNHPAPLDLPPHRLKVALLQPQIAPNTGNIARLCVAAGAELHLVRPLGFVLSDRQLRRSAMDYWPRLRLTVHDDTDAFFRAASGRVWLFSSEARRALWDADFADGDYLVFGSEVRGIDASFLEAHHDRALRIPQITGERCLNLSTAAGIALYEALRKVWLGHIGIGRGTGVPSLASDRKLHGQDARATSPRIRSNGCQD